MVKAYSEIQNNFKVQLFFSFLIFSHKLDILNFNVDYSLSIACNTVSASCTERIKQYL